MSAYTIEACSHLSGEVEVNTSKNAVLPLLCCALLTAEPLTLESVPHLTDVDTLTRILASCGCSVQAENDRLTLQSLDPCLPGQHDDFRKMRASVLVLGPLLARLGEARVSLPGGCAIGPRPIDLHLKGLQALGATVTQANGWVTVSGKLTGGDVYLDLPSVGATENILMAAVLAKGTTRIENAAKEPEIADLAACLCRMGARIAGAGSGVITVEGVQALHGTAYRPIADRIEAGTLACAAAITKGSVLLRGARPEHMGAVLFKLREAGVQVHLSPGGLRVSGTACRPFELRTQGYPGFPTDVQAPMMVTALIAPGTSLMMENVFENRFMHAPELCRMGAHIRIENRLAVIEGGYPLTGAVVTSTDLRAGAALMLAGLAAEGKTTLLDPENHIARGYQDLPGKLCRLGARITHTSEIL